MGAVNGESGESMEIDDVTGARRGETEDWGN